MTLNFPSSAAHSVEAKRRLLLNLRPVPDLDRWVRLVAPCAGGFSGEVVGTALSGEDEALLRFLRESGSLRLDRVERVTDLDGAARLWAGATAAIGMRLHFAVLTALRDAARRVAL